MSRIDPYFVLGVANTNILPANLASQGATDLESSYSQDGPGPGLAVNASGTKWLPYIKGNQTQSIVSRVVQGGFAGVNEAAIAYRLKDDTSDGDYRGWDEPNLLNDWTTPDNGWGASAAWSDVTSTVIEETGEIIVTVREGSSDGYTFKYNPRSGEWTTLYQWAQANTPALYAPIIHAYDAANRRLLLYSGNGAPGERTMACYQSVDGGETWSLYTRGQWGTTIAATTGEIAVHESGDWLAFVDGHQLASSNRGITWDLVSASVTGSQHTPVRIGNGFAVFYQRTSDSLLCVRLLGSARANFADATLTALSGAAASGIAGCRDYDGAVYCYFRGTAGAGTSEDVQTIVTRDQGASWDNYTFNHKVYGPWSPANLLASCGSLWSVGLCAGHADVVGTFAVMKHGGWSNVENGVEGWTAGTRDRQDRVVPGGDTADYFPFDLPQNAVWTRLGSAGSQSLDAATIGYWLSASQAQQESYQSAAMIGGSVLAGQACFKTSSGTNGLGVSPTSYGSGLFILTRTSNGSAHGDASIEIGSDGLQIWDSVTGTSLGTIALDLTEWLHIRWQTRITASASAFTLWYRRDGDIKWTRAFNDVAITRTVAAVTALITWGHNPTAVVGSSNLYVRYLSAATPATWFNGVDSIVDTDNEPSEGILGLWFGRAVPGRNYRYPIPELTDSLEPLGFIAGAGGQALIGDIVQHSLLYQYAVDNISALTSPVRQWKSTDNSEQRFVFDMGAGHEQWWFGAMALVVINAKCRYWRMRVHNGSSYEVYDQMDLGWSSINYTLVGDYVRPRAGTATIDRYFGEDELKGAHLVCSTAGNSVAREIVHQSPGYWSTSTSLQQIRLTLKDTDGTESSSGSGELVHHSGVQVIFTTSEAPGRYVSVTAESGSVTPGDVYSAGVVAVCRLLAAGTQPSWDWSRIREYQRSITRRPDGHARIRSRGRPIDMITYNWPDGIFLQHIRTLTSPANFYGDANNGNPIGSQEDTTHVMPSLLSNQLQNGKVPALVLPTVPLADGTITDPTLWHWGNITADRIGVHGIQGREGTDEVVRLDGFTLETLW